MRFALLPIHIVAGLLSVASGFIALYSLKGASLHKKSGVVFAYAMLATAIAGTWLAILKSQPANIAGGIITVYLVTTGVLTLRRRDNRSRLIDAIGMMIALSASIYFLMIGVAGLRSASGTVNGVPAAMLFLFATVTLLGAAGDFRSLLADGLRGASRIARHLWRMCFAMYVATGSFFLGQAKVFPKPIRIMPLLAAPVLLIVLTMFYWMFRVSFTKWYRRRAIDSLKRNTLQTA